MVIMRCDVMDKIRNSVSSKIFFQVSLIGDFTNLQLTCINLVSYPGHISLRGMILDGDVDGRFGEGEIGDLIVVPLLREAVFYQVILWHNVVHVAMTFNHLRDIDRFRQKATSALADPCRQVDLKRRATFTG